MKTRFGLVCFDVDSTLVDFEGIDFLADGNPEIVALTEAAMNGDIPIEEVYGRRLSIVRPSRERLEALAHEYIARRLSDSAEVIAELRAAHVDVHLVTAGIEQAILPLAASFGLEPRAVHAVRLLLDDGGAYVDYDRRSPLARSGGKETVVINLRSRTKGRVAFIGDGISDLETKPVVDLFVGFGGVKRRAEVEKEAAVYITEKSLRPLLQWIEEKS